MSIRHHILSSEFTSIQSDLGQKLTFVWSQRSRQVLSSNQMSNPISPAHLPNNNQIRIQLSETEHRAINIVG